MAHWTTDDIPEKDRFAIWREWFGPLVLGAESALAREQRRRFKASFTVTAVGGATLVDINALACSLSRTSKDIDDGPRNSLFIFQQMTGPAWSVATGRDEQILGHRNISYGFTDLPFKTLPSEERVLSTRMLKIPLTAAHDDRGLRYGMVARELRPKPGPSALFAAYVSAFLGEAADLQGEAAEVAVDTLRRLALLAEPPGGPAADTEGGFEAVADAQLFIAMKFIRAHLSRPDLSVERVAAALRISPRHLHRLFVPTGTTFARYVADMRLEAVAATLLTEPQRSIIDIAFAYGFNSSSAFYRAFNRCHGMTPQDYRLSRVI